MSQTNFKRLFLTCMFGALSLPASALAQFHDADPFGESDDNAAAPPPAAQGSIIDPSTAALFGGAPAPLPGSDTARPTDAWGDMNVLPSDERIEDTYEMKMREELRKPLPKRNPFSNRFEDMREQMNPKKSGAYGNKDKL